VRSRSAAALALRIPFFLRIDLLLFVFLGRRTVLELGLRFFECRADVLYAFLGGCQVRLQSIS